MIPRIDRYRRAGLAWAELLLALAILSLLFQIYSDETISLSRRLAWKLNPSNWTYGMAFLLNLIVVSLLCSIAYGKKGLEAIKRWAADKKQLQAANQAKSEKKKSKAELEEERALYARMLEARKKQS